MSLWRRSSFLVGSLVLLLPGCASYSGAGLQPGVATESEVRQRMGPPAVVWPDAHGGRLLSYPRGPMGLQTFMVRLDGNGRLLSIEQVLDEAHFNRVQRGMSKEDIGRLLGPPRETMAFSRRNEVAWDYRFRDTWGYVSIFSVIFAPDGTVKSTVTLREEPIFPFPFFPG